MKAISAVTSTNTPKEWEICLCVISFSYLHCRLYFITVHGEWRHLYLYLCIWVVWTTRVESPYMSAGLYLLTCGPARTRDATLCPLHAVCYSSQDVPHPLRYSGLHLINAQTSKLISAHFNIVSIFRVHNL